MDQDAYILLLYKELKGEISPQELQQLENWVQASNDNRALAEEVRHIWQESKSSARPIQLDLDQDFQRLQQSLPKDTPVVALQTGQYRRWSIAATLALLLASGWWYLSWDNFTAGEEITFQTTEEKRQFDLPDGSQVWLAPNSQLTLANDFGTENRDLELEGMGYFEVATDSMLPFEVQTAFSKVRVLGTAFNLRAMEDESKSSVTVTEGKIAFTALRTMEEVVLSAGNQGTVDHQSSRLEKGTTQGSNEIAWQRGTFIFNQHTLANVLADIGNYYQIDLQVENSELLNCSYTSRLSIAKGRTYILESIATYLQAELIEDKGTVLLRGGQCP